MKRIETEGYGRYAATNHDVKAVEYFVREGAPERAHSWIHFGLTSEDVNNLAYRLLLIRAVEEVLLPAVRDVRDDLVEFAHEYADAAMLARTHGQPATPTTFGKEMAVYAGRLGRALGRANARRRPRRQTRRRVRDLRRPPRRSTPTSTGGRSPGVRRVARPRLRRTRTQVNPCDDLARSSTRSGGNDRPPRPRPRRLALRLPTATSDRTSTTSETGSSTMPHKVNPIDFENAEGNLSKANSDLVFLADYLTTSRLQRDLSDSTVKRNIGAAFAYCLVGYRKANGLDKVVPNETVMREDLKRTPEVIGEAVQTILRREGHTDAYERVKALTRGERVTLDDFRDLFDDLDVDEDVREELRALTPATTPASPATSWIISIEGYPTVSFSSVVTGCMPSKFQRRRLAVLLLALVAFAYWFLVRPWHLRWGVTDEELEMILPGDQSLRTPESQVTHAITIGAGPEDVWPWLAQIGQGRAGFYSYDWLEISSALISTTPTGFSPNTRTSTSAISSDSHPRSIRSKHPNRLPR